PVRDGRRAARRRGPAAGAPARAARRAPLLPPHVSLDLARPLAARGDAARHAGGGARDDRGAERRPARGGLRLEPARGARGGHPLPAARARPRARDGTRRPGGGAGPARARALPRRVGRAAGGGRGMRIAMVSEHASPLAVLGGVDAGGQNVHVAALARALARRGAEVTVYTRRDDPRLPERVAFGDEVVVQHVSAGPARAIAKDELLPWMGAFGVELERAWRRQRPDLVHAHFWMSGLASLQAAERLELPVVQTFHALGAVKQRHQGAQDTSPPERQAIERELLRRCTGVIATCRDEREELRTLGGDPGRVRIVPCGVDLGRFRPEGRAWRRRAGRARVVAVTRLVARKGVAELIEALARLDDVELLVAGGLARAALDADAEAQRLRAVATRCGVADRVTLLGRVEREEVPALLRSADLVACCPW